MSEHNEPWYVFSHYSDPEIRTKDGDRLIAVMLPSQRGIARRIVACVNACAGVTDEQFAGGWTAKGISDYAKSLEPERR